MKNSIFILIIAISFTFTNEICIEEESLYNSALYLESFNKIKTNKEIYNSNECLHLAFKVSFKLENFDDSKTYLDILLKKDPDNLNYITDSKLLVKILQEYKSSKYTFDKLEIDDAINEYKAKLTDEDLSSISLFYSGLAAAYTKKDKISSFSDTLNFKYYDLAVENYKIANKINSNKNYIEDILNISKTLTVKGKNSMSNSEYDLALKYFNKAINYSEDYSTAHFYKGQLYMKIQDFRLAVDSFLYGLKIKPGNYKILYMVGSCYEKIGDLENSEKLYRKSIEINQTYDKGMFALSRVLFSQQKFNESIEQLKKILEIDVKYIKAYELLSDIYINLNDQNKAKNACETGISQDSKSYALYARLSAINNDQEQFQQAVDNSNSALSIKKKYGPALIELGRAHVYLCNMVAAEDAFKRAKFYDRRQVSQLQEWAKEHNKSTCK